MSTDIHESLEQAGVITSEVIGVRMWVAIDQPITHRVLQSISVAGTASRTQSLVF